MASRRRRALEETTPRPICGCGKNPVTHQVQLTVRRLILDREAGAHSQPYWAASWRGAAHTAIEALVCDDCLGNRINVVVAVDATMAQAKKGSPA